MENSKSELLTWLNGILKSNITKIEQLGNGVAYCKLLSYIDPTCLNSNKIILKPKTQIDHISNLKVFQTAMQKLHLKKQFDIDKVSKCFFHENYDLAIFLKKQYTIRFQGINKENTQTLNTSLENIEIQFGQKQVVQNQDTTHQNYSIIDQITEIIQSQDSAEQKVCKISELLNITQSPNQNTSANPFSEHNFQTNVFIANQDHPVGDLSIFKTDSKRQQQIAEQQMRTSMLCETPEAEEMLLDPTDEIFSSKKQSSSKIILKLQSHQKPEDAVGKKETPNFFGSPFPAPQESSLADFIRSESKQQQQYMQQYSMQKQLQMQNQITPNEYQSPFRDVQYSQQKNEIFQPPQPPQSYKKETFYSCHDKGAILEE